MMFFYPGLNGPSHLPNTPYGAHRVHYGQPTDFGDYLGRATCFDVFIVEQSDNVTAGGSVVGEFLYSCFGFHN